MNITIYAFIFVPFCMLNISPLKKKKKEDVSSVTFTVNTWKQVSEKHSSKPKNDSTQKEGRKYMQREREGGEISVHTLI